MAGPRIGLALGGGGARGLAHIAALEVFDELGIRPKRIAGTSIGALIGAGYAAGMTGKELRAHTLDMLGNQRAVFAKLMSLRRAPFREIFAQGALGIIQFDAEKTLKLFLPDSLPDDFSALRLPLTVVATDYYGWREAALTAGPLRKALAASIALPIVFRPVDIDGKLLVDGGMVNPLPADKLKGCSVIVGIDVVGGPKPGTRRMPGPRDAMFGATQILMQTVIAERLKRERIDILMRPAIDRFRVLDFLKVRDVLKASEPMKDDLKRKLDKALAKA